MPIATILALIEALATFAPQIPGIVTAIETTIGLLKSGADPTPEQLTAIEAGLAAAHAQLQADSLLPSQPPTPPTPPTPPAQPQPPTLEAASAAFIAGFESVRLHAYQDVAGVWTIGYGHTLGVKQGDVWTEAQAIAAKTQDTAATLAFVVSCNTHHPWTEDQIVALTSLAYNIGKGGFRSSSVLKFHNAGDTAAAADAFLLWDMAHVDGVLVVVEGLRNRRRAERARYLSQPVPA